MRRDLGFSELAHAHLHLQLFFGKFELHLIGGSFYKQTTGRRRLSPRYLEPDIVTQWRRARIRVDELRVRRGVPVGLAARGAPGWRRPSATRASRPPPAATA